MTDAEMILKAAVATRDRLMDFAASKDCLPDHYPAAVYDKGAFDVFIDQLESIIEKEMPR